MLKIRLWCHSIDAHLQLWRRDVLARAYLLFSSAGRLLEEALMKLLMFLKITFLGKFFIAVLTLVVSYSSMHSEMHDKVLSAFKHFSTITHLAHKFSSQLLWVLSSVFKFDFIARLVVPCQLSFKFRQRKLASWRVSFLISVT